MQTFHIAINLDLTRWGSCKGHNHKTYQMGPKFLVNVIFCAQPPDSMTSLKKKKKPQMLWLVHDIQILWHHCCEIHTLMQQSDWCEIHNLMRWSDWCEQHTTLQANITFSLIKKKTKKDWSYQDTNISGLQVLMTSVTIIFTVCGQWPTSKLKTGDLSSNYMYTQFPE